MIYFLLLAIIQGITEFLPISSSAHLILLPQLTNNIDQGPLIDIAAHVGTLFAILLYFHKECKTLIIGLFDIITFKKTENQKLAFFIILSAFPVLIVGAIMQKLDLIDYLRDIRIIAFTSIFFGIVLFFADKYGATNKNKVGLKEIIIFGFMQVLAIFPGTSRSGITMTASRILGFNREEGAKYSLLMSIPVIAVFGAYAFLQLFIGDEAVNGQVASDQLMGGLVVMIFSFLAALLTLFLFMKYIKKIGFLPFVIYRILLGCVLLLIIFKVI